MLRHQNQNTICGRNTRFSFAIKTIIKDLSSIVLAIFIIGADNTM